jgi:hypothetical protein
MRCSSCGERLAATDERCSLCGAAVTRALTESSPVVRRCPRCHYAGQGIGYFRRPGHLALLAAVSLFTWGVGGIVYWLLRRRYSACPNCGLSWPEGGYVLGPAWGPAEASRPEPALPSGGIRRRMLGAGLALFGTALIGGGLVGGEPPAVMAGCIFGLAGTGAFFWGWRALQERRAAVRQVLERRVLQLATRRGGSLTVTEVASDLDLSLTAAEGVLIAMDDGFRVRSDITDEGVLVFEFPEVHHRRLPG